MVTEQVIASEVKISGTKIPLYTEVIFKQSEINSYDQRKIAAFCFLRSRYYYAYDINTDKHSQHSIFYFIHINILLAIRGDPFESCFRNIYLY